MRVCNNEITTIRTNILLHTPRYRGSFIAKNFLHRKRSDGFWSRTKAHDIHQPLFLALNVAERGKFLVFTGSVLKPLHDKKVLRYLLFENSPESSQERF